MFTRNPQNRIKSWTGTVHFADASGAIVCGPVKTAATYLHWSVEDVTCKKCVAMCGSDTPSDFSDAPQQDENVSRRAAERAARQAARWES